MSGVFFSFWFVSGLLLLLLFWYCCGFGDDLDLLLLGKGLWRSWGCRKRLRFRRGRRFLKRVDGWLLVVLMLCCWRMRMLCFRVFLQIRFVLRCYCLLTSGFFLILCFILSILCLFVVMILSGHCYQGYSRGAEAGADSRIENYDAESHFCCFRFTCHGSPPENGSGLVCFPSIHFSDVLICFNFSCMD